MHRQCGDVLNWAVERLNDISLVDLLLLYGANPAYAHPLHSVAGFQAVPEGSRFRGPPFSARRPLVEHLLMSEVAGVKYSMGSRPACRRQTAWRR